MVEFDDTAIAFKGKSDKELKQARLLFKLVSRPSLVKFGKVSTDLALKLNLPIKGIIKKTIFKQFCGGETIKESLSTSSELSKYNVKTILDYSIEGKTSEEDFEATVNEIIQTILEAKDNPFIPFAVFKVTGISTFEVLEQANDGIEKLNDQQRKKYDQTFRRVDAICKAAYENDVPLFIDAEESWIQDSIDDLVHQMSLKYNREKAIVYNTLQMYRHDRIDFLHKVIALAKDEKWFPGFKIVRGAYMEKERERAQEKGYPSPIQTSKEDSDKDYDKAVAICVDNIDTVSICAGTHNEESSAKLAALLEGKGIAKDDNRIYFAQLLGMSDHISFNLADKNYQVAKYVPYGPVKEVLPYLIRRAEENTSVAGQTGRELSLINKELKRRKL